MKILRLTDVQERVPYSKNHIYRLIRAGKFPQRVRLGPARVGWVEEEIEAWVAAKVRERDAHA